MRKFLVFLVLLAVVLAVLDRVAVSGVQREIARQVAAKYDLPSEPQIEVRGIPFLTQAVAGRYEEIGVKIGRMAVPGGAKITRIDATLYGVRAPLIDLIQSPETADIRADRVTGLVVIPKETLDARAPRGLKVTGGGDDSLNVTGKILVAGVEFPINAKMKIEVVKGGIRLTPENVNGVQIPDAARLLSFNVPIKDLPLSLKIESVRSTSEGLAVEGTATDVPLRA